MPTFFILFLNTSMNCLYIPGSLGLATFF